MKKNGIIASLITPLSNFDQIDLNSLENLIEHVIKGGVSGISILGQTGEEHCLDYHLRQKMIAAASQVINNRVPFYVNLTGTSLMECYMLGNYAADCGAAAIVSAPPYYYCAGQAELIEFYEELVDKISLPVYVYNMGGRRWQFIIEPDTIFKLSQIDRIIGVKDSSANSIYINGIMSIVNEMNRNFDFIIANEEVIGEGIMFGATDGMAGGACLYPKLYVALYTAAKERNIDKYLELQSIVMKISRHIYSIGQYHSSYLKGLKCALNVKGIISDDYMAPPFHKFEKPERERIINALSQLDEIIPEIYK